MYEGILHDFWADGITRRLEVHIWTRSPCQGALEWTNTLRDRCSHISGLVVKTADGLRALMKSALPLLITTAASGALYLAGWEEAGLTARVINSITPRIVRKDSSISLASQSTAPIRAT